MKKAVVVFFGIIAILMGQCFAQAQDDQKIKVILLDNTEYVLTDFIFLSDHNSFKGGFYTSCLFKVNYGLIVQNDIKSYIVEGKDIKSINMVKPENSRRFEGVTIETLNGEKISGTILHDPRDTWIEFSRFWCEGAVSILGKEGTYHELLENVKSIVNNPEVDGKFDVVDYEGNKKTITGLTFGYIGECPLDDIQIFGLTNEIEVVVDKVKVSVGVSEIKKIDFSDSRTITVFLKSGENSMVEFETITRIKGNIGPSEVLFMPIFDNEGNPTIKSIIFDAS